MRKDVEDVVDGMVIGDDVGMDIEDAVGMVGIDICELIEIALY